MIITEEEAKTKWCCGPDGCGTNIQIGFVDFGDGTGKSTWERRCIASECMAWRWAQVEEANPNDAGTVRMDSHPGLPKHLKDAGAYKDRRIRAPRGSCGLAGKADQ